MHGVSHISNPGNFSKDVSKCILVLLACHGFIEFTMGLYGAFVSGTGLVDVVVLTLLL